MPFRNRSSTTNAPLTNCPPAKDSPDYSPRLARVAARILYKSPLPSRDDLPVYILDSAALPDAREVEFDTLLPYVLDRFPTEEELIGGKGYEIVFFAGGEPREAGASRRPKVPGAHHVVNAVSGGGSGAYNSGRSSSSGGGGVERKKRPGWNWFVQAYHVLGRALRKRLQRLYLVHERKWVRLMSEAFSSIVSPKVRRKIVHVGSLSALALHIPIEDLLIPPSAYELDRRRSPQIHAPYASAGKRAFGTKVPLPVGEAGMQRLPRVLREATSFLLEPKNIDAEGLFRVNAKATFLDVLKESYGRGQKFIVWKEGENAVSSSVHWREGYGEVTVDSEILPIIDGYSLHTAAGLIKLWYAELREPLFRQSSYTYLERVFGDKETPIEVSGFLDLIGPASDWSPLTKVAKGVMTAHLFPLLSEVAAHADKNKMHASNLAVCFAPSVMRGPDPMEDAKMTNTIRRLLEFGIEHWRSDLASACGQTDASAFYEMLKAPKVKSEWEDPADQVSGQGEQSGEFSNSEQTSGIIMLEQEESSTESSEDEPNRPPLPPRSTLPITVETDVPPVSAASTAPPVVGADGTGSQAAAPPIADGTTILSPVQQQQQAPPPQSATATMASGSPLQQQFPGGGSPTYAQLPPHQQQQIKRKPVPANMHPPPPRYSTLSDILPDGGVADGRDPFAGAPRVDGSPERMASGAESAVSPLSDGMLQQQARGGVASPESLVSPMSSMDVKGEKKDGGEKS